MCCLALVSGFPLSSLPFCLPFWPESTLKLFHVVLFLVLPIFFVGEKKSFRELSRLLNLPRLKDVGAVTHTRRTNLQEHK